MGFLSFVFILWGICFILYDRTTDTDKEDKRT